MEIDKDVIFVLVVQICTGIESLPNLSTSVSCQELNIADSHMMKPSRTAPCHFHNRCLLLMLHIRAR
jgi:hypothetical protein